MYQRATIFYFFFIKTRKTHKNICEYTRIGMPYLSLTDCQCFVKQKNKNSAMFSEK